MEKDRGFIMLIVVVLVALAALKYFLNWDIFDAAASEQGRSTISYLRDIVNTVWAYIGYPVTLTWNQVAWPILQFAWDSFQQLMEVGRASLNS